MLKQNHKKKILNALLILLDARYNGNFIFFRKKFKGIKCTETSHGTLLFFVDVLYVGHIKRLMQKNYLKNYFVNISFRPINDKIKITKFRKSLVG